MSATRDQSQKTTFVYSNLYQLYRKGKEAAQKAQVPSETPTEAQAAESFVSLPSERNVLKARDLKQPEQNSPSKAQAPRIEPYRAPEFISKRIPARVDNPLMKSAVHPEQEGAIRSLRDNLKTLNDLHARLRFMLQELEELVKDSK